MRAVLRAAGVRATLLEQPGVRHGYAGLAARVRPAVACTALAFFDRSLRGGGT